MVKVKEMPAKEKYDNLMASIKHESYKPAFVEQRLGSQAAAEFQAEWKKGIKPIPENASYEEKYEIAYGNLIWMGASAFDFVRNRMGEDGLNKFIRADVDGFKRENNSPALLLLKLIRALSPGMAFTMTAKQFAYKLQWITPFTIPELSRTKMVMEMAHCKILDFPGGESGCLIGCQKVYPIWFAEQFGVAMKADRKGYACTLTFIPSK